MKATEGIAIALRNLMNGAEVDTHGHLIINISKPDQKKLQDMLNDCDKEKRARAKAKTEPSEPMVDSVAEYAASWARLSGVEPWHLLNNREREPFRKGAKAAIERAMTKEKQNG